MTAAKTKSFIAAFLGDRNVAAVSPSSPRLVRRLMRHLDLPRTKILVELGPAYGVATRPILAALPAEARLLAVETNRGFAAALKTVDDPRLTVIEDDARRLPAIMAERGVDAADAVIASIPFTYLSQDERRALVAAAKKILKPGGVFVIFHQYSLLMLPYVKKEFSQVKAEFELLNVFPCFVIEGRN